MKKIISKLKNLIPTKRKLIQLYCALLFNANLKGFTSGNIYRGTTKQVCVPGLNCYSCPGAVGACPLGSLQGSFSADKSTLFYVGGIILLYSILFGRMICGWFCPFGFIQELVYKIKTPKLKKSIITRVLSYFKYVILVFFVFIVPITYALRDTPLPAFCKYICPAGTLEGGIGLLANKVNESYFSMLGPLFTWKFVLMVSIIVSSVFIFRMFCRFICPLGALYGLFNKFSVFGVKIENSKCTDCNLCVSRCKLDVKKVGDQECISCGECIDVCPTKAIIWKGTNIFIKNNEIPSNTSKIESKTKTRNITRAISCVLLLAILIGSVIYYWNDGNDQPKLPQTSQEQSTDVEYGNQIGQHCYGAELQIVDENGIKDEVVNPAKTGKITIINFWGTWCGPCVKELPYFDQIASEYKDNVDVFAIHTAMQKDTAPEYVSKYYPNSDITFALDYATDDIGLVGGYYSLLGGRGTYPYTVIIDENGVIVKIFVEALHYEDLKAVVEEHLK